MFKKKFLSVLLALGAVVLLPTVALAQTEEESLEEMNTVEWDTDWDYEWDTDDYDYDYDTATAITSVGALTAILGAVLIPALIIVLGIYFYTSIAYMKIAKKLDHPNPWFAWVPILNLVLVLQLADMSPWLVLLILVPGVNGIAILILSVITMMRICEKRGMDRNLGFLMLIPIANLVLPGLIAWKKDEGGESAQQQQTAMETPPTAQQ
jgi:hypothetical protein